MKKLCLFTVLLLLCPTFLFAADDQPNKKPKEFIKLKKSEGKVTALQIAVTRYEDQKNEAFVDLVGVVHIGDGDYYQELNKRFKSYDVVLYELVAPEGMKPQKKKKSDNILSMLPKMYGVLLDLDQQLDVVDYTPKNFVHADMSWDEMMKAAEKRGDNQLTLGLSLLLDQMRQANKDAKKGKGKQKEDIDLMEALNDPNLLKRQMAEQLTSEAKLGETMEKLIVEDRNKKACEVLDKQLAAGKKKIAIFYGAAHNPDFDKRLRVDRKMVYHNQEWLTAWKMDGKPKPLAERLLKALSEK